MSNRNPLVNKALLSIVALAVVMSTTSGCVIQEWRRAEAVRTTYVSVLHTEPSVDTLNFWVKEVENGLPLSELKDRLMKSDEYYQMVTTDSFNKLLNRDPDPTALEASVTMLREGRIDPEGLEALIKKSPEYKSSHPAEAAAPAPAKTTPPPAPSAAPPAPPTT